ncbi:MAG: chemotaxis response regulator protein-glutamate methylesterase [Rhodospirillales bacterium 70-18]|nr:chemotaxis-specific protein-glutamate methyltransferase CheB [Rhodospirillales bacterium]OJY76233.1 MAG: chemotaxis response regulator protein-glutamate methylesterase [Rhodospirillales bacterium 70-18]
MICDDSVVIRGALTRMLEADPLVRVVARAANGQAALDELRRLAQARQAVDVVVLDIEMPVMDGMTALPLLLRADPGLRVIMASTLTTRGADIAMQALRLGAADYVPKPSTQAINDDSFRREITAKVRGLARLRQRTGLAQPGGAPPLALRPAARLAPALLAVGSSTGGPQALFTLVQALGPRLPVPVVLTQHMPATFTPILAEHITRLGGLPCAEARDREALAPGRIYLAPGDRHLLVEGSAATGLRARLTEDPPENFCRPSVDPMLRSAAVACAGRVLVVMLTGMGHDGLAGTRTVVAAGGAAVAQDEVTSVVWGMPGAIAQAGLCQHVLPLPAIGAKVLSLLAQAPTPPARAGA